jgi:hypothetical protein
MQPKSPLVIFALALLTVIAAPACDATPPDHFRDFDTGTGGGSESDTGGSGGDGGGSLGSPGDGDGDGDGDMGPVLVCYTAEYVYLSHVTWCDAGTDVACGVGDYLDPGTKSVCCSEDSCRFEWWTNGCYATEAHVCDIP